MTTKTNTAKTAATETTAREFVLRGVAYERKASGYCYRDNVRIRAEVFEAAEREFDAREAEERAAAERESAPARNRRSKDVAGEYETSEGTVTLTAKQLDFLREVAKLSDDDLLGNFVSGCWCDILCDAIGGQFSGKPMTVGAMLSTICEKGLGERYKEDRSSVGARTRKVTAFVLTQKGREVWVQIIA